MLTTLCLILSVSGLGEPAALHGRARGVRTFRGQDGRLVLRHSGFIVRSRIKLEPSRLRKPARLGLVAHVNVRSASRTAPLHERLGTRPELEELVSTSTALKRPAPAEGEITILFKDRRAPEQIRNYALSRTVLYLPGDPGQVIPVKQIDMPATERVNRQRGKLFQLPALP